MPIAGFETLAQVLGVLSGLEHERPGTKPMPRQSPSRRRSSRPNATGC